MRSFCLLLMVLLVLCITSQAGEEYRFGTYAVDGDNLLQIDSCGFNLLRWSVFVDTLNQARLDSFETLGMDIIMYHQATDPFYAPIYRYSWSRYMVWEADKSPECDSLIGMDHYCGLIDEGAWMVPWDSVAEGDTEIVVSGPRRYDTEGHAGILYQSIYRYTNRKTPTQEEVLYYTASFMIKGCDTLETTPIGKIRILRWISDPDSLDTLGTLDLYQDTDHSTYKEFKLEYNSYDLFAAGSSQAWVKIKYEIEYYGGIDTLWIDRIKVYDIWGDQLVNIGLHNQLITDYATQYLTKPALIAWYPLDQPWWECFLPYRYIDSLLEENNIRKLAGTKCVGDSVEVEKYIRQAKPKDFIMEYYPLGKDVPDSGPEFQGALDKLTYALNKYRERTLEDTLDFYLLAQAHKWCDSISCDPRDPSPSEIRCQTNLGIAYGVDGVLYYQYGSRYGDESQTWFLFQGLVSPEGEPYPKWYMVRDTIQPYIQKIGPILSDSNFFWLGAGSSDTVANIQNSFIDNITSQEYPPDSAYIEVTFFIDSAGAAPDTDYFMLTNRRCLPDEDQNVTCHINKSSRYKIIDICSSVIDTCIPDSTITGYLETIDAIPFTTHLDPGEGKLFKMVPYSDSLHGSSVPMKWQGGLIVSGDVTVDSGKTLTIYRPAEISFTKDYDCEGSGVNADKCEIIVNGSLRVDPGGGGVLKVSPVQKNSRGRTRTSDRVVNSHLLYRLSYAGISNQKYRNF